jgi:hypothetical protein
LEAEIVGEHKSRAGPVSTTHRRYRQVRQLQVGVERGNLLVVPLGDVAKVDIGQDWASQLQLVRLHAGNVNNDIDAANDRGELHQLVRSKLIAGDRHVRGAEIHSAVIDLVDPGAGPNRLIIELYADRAGRCRAPFRVNRRGEARAGAGDLHRLRLGPDGTGHAGHRYGQRHAL